MIKATKIFVRPSTNVPWYTVPGPMGSYIKTTFVDSGKRSSIQEVISEDGLTKTIITEWTDQAAYDAFNNDSVCKQMFKDRKNYIDAMGITTSAAAVETI